MKSYCCKNNNLVAMGWFLVILGLVITSGVDGAPISLKGTALEGFPEGIVRSGENVAQDAAAIKTAQNAAALKKFHQTEKEKEIEIAEAMSDPNTPQDICKLAKLMEKSPPMVEKLCDEDNYWPPSTYNTEAVPVIHN